MHRIKQMAVLRTLAMWVMLVFCSGIVGAEENEIESLINKADALVATNPDSAEIIVDEALRGGKPSPSGPQSAALNIVLSTARYSRGNVEGALAAGKEALNVARGCGDDEMKIEALTNLGVYYRVLQHPDSALVCYNEALAFVRRSGDAEDEASLLISIAVLFVNCNRIEESVPYARRAVDLAERSESIVSMMYAGSQAAIIYYKTGNKDEGFRTLSRIVSMARRQNAPRYALKAYTTAMEMHLREGHMDSVNMYMKRGRELMREVPEEALESIGFMEECAIVLAEQGRHEESIALMRRMLAMKDAANFVPRHKIWHRLAENYRDLGNVAECAAAYEKCLEIADSIRQSDIDEQISEFDVRYGTMQKQLEISRLEQKQARMRLNMVIWGAGAVVLLICAAGYMLYRRRREAMERIRQNLRGVEQERARLARELHDGVCNDLYGIGLLLGTGGKTEAGEEIRRVASEVRHISHELMPPRFSNAGLADILRDLGRRSGDFIKVDADAAIDSLTDNEKAYQLYRIVQELSANIRKHTDAAGAELSASALEGRLRIRLSYSGRASGASGDGSGIGLETVQRRCRLVGAHISSHSEGDSHIFVLTL